MSTIKKYVHSGKDINKEVMSTAQLEWSITIDLENRQNDCEGSNICILFCSVLKLKFAFLFQNPAYFSVSKD